jgi:hypothetical protein
MSTKTVAFAPECDRNDDHARLEKALQPRQAAPVTGQETARRARQGSGLICSNSGIQAG